MSRSAIASLFGIHAAEVRRDPQLRSQVNRRDLRFLLMHELVWIDGGATVRLRPAGKLVLSAYELGREDRSGSEIAALVLRKGARA